MANITPRKESHQHNNETLQIKTPDGICTLLILSLQETKASWESRSYLRRYIFSTACCSCCEITWVTRCQSGVLFSKIQQILSHKNRLQKNEKRKNRTKQHNCLGKGSVGGTAQFVIFQNSVRFSCASSLLQTYWHHPGHHCPRGTPPPPRDGRLGRSASALTKRTCVFYELPDCFCRVRFRVDRTLPRRYPHKPCEPNRGLCGCCSWVWFRFCFQTLPHCCRVWFRVDAQQTTPHVLHFQDFWTPYERTIGDLVDMINSPTYKLAGTWCNVKKSKKNTGI